MFNFSKVRPYPTQVAEIVIGTGVLPLDDLACTYLSSSIDAESILQLMIKAAIAAQGTNTLGIVAPAPDLTLDSGKKPSGGIGANYLLDLLDGSVNIAYMAPNCPRAWVVRGTVIIPNPQAPNDVATQKKLTIDVYPGHLINSISGPVTTLVMDPDAGQFSWK